MPRASKATVISFTIVEITVTLFALVFTYVMGAPMMTTSSIQLICQYQRELSEPTKKSP